MRNISRSKDKIAEIMEEKAFKFLHEGKYKEAYESLLHLKNKDRHLDKVNFALGFICELGIVEGTNIELAESYYSKAIELGNIEAKIRMAMLAEKGKILNINEAYTLYNEVIEHYQSHNEELPESAAKSFANNVAFSYYRLGRMYEKSIFISETGTKDNKLKALELYDLSLKLYNKYQLNSLDKAKVLNRTGWIRYEVFLEENSWQNIEKTQKELENIEKIFKEADKLGSEQAKLGLLNIQAYKYSLINGASERNIIQAKSLIKEALSIDPNHLPTLLLAIQIETIALTSPDHKPALEFFRKALELAPSNKEVKKKFDEMIRYQARDFAQNLERHLKENVQETIQNATKRGASQEAIETSQKFQEIFYPEGYSSAYWITKQTYRKQDLDKGFEGNIVNFAMVLANRINQNKLFKELYEINDQENLAKQIVTSLLKSEINISLIKLIIKNGQIKQIEQDQLDQLLTNQLEIFYSTKNNVQQGALSFTKEEHQWKSSQEEFIKLSCNKFIEERNAIEAIAKGKAFPLPDTVDELKQMSNRVINFLNVPPLSYLANTLGGNSLLYALTGIATDVAYDRYKQNIISGFIAVDKLLPRREEANEIILEISKEFASKYSAQIANTKDYESLDKLAEVAIERMMSHTFAQTGIIKQIQDSISNKVNSALNFAIGKDKELKPANTKQLLYEGIWYGKSSGASKRLRTHTEKREFEDNWEANELLERTGIITKDKRIFGNIKNIEKYGCASGDEVDVSIRGLQPIDQSKFSSELKSKLNKAYGKQQKLQSVAEQTSLSNKDKLDNTKNTTSHKNFSTAFAKGMIAIGAVFLIISLSVMYIPLLALASTIVPGLIIAGGLLTISGIVFGRNTKNYTASHVNINETQVDHQNEANKEREAKQISIDKIKGPTPVDIYNISQNKGNTKQEHKSSTEIDRSSMTKQDNFVSRLSSRDIVSTSGDKESYKFSK